MARNNRKRNNREKGNAIQSTAEPKMRETRESEQSSMKLWWIALLVPSVLTTIGIVVSNWLFLDANRIAKLNSPENISSADELYYCITETNLLDGDTLQPQSGMLTIKIVNESNRPAKNIEMVFYPISDSPKITSDNSTLSHQEAPFDSRVAKIDYIPPRSRAMVDIKESVDKYPPNTGRSPMGDTRLKYRYCAELLRVTIEGEPISIKPEYCRRHLLPLEEDGGMYSAATVNWPR